MLSACLDPDDDGGGGGGEAYIYFRKLSEIKDLNYVLIESKFGDLSKN